MSEEHPKKEESLPPADNPAALPADQVAGAIFPANETGSSNPSTAEDMEVHHHGHVHEKSKWKEYAFQFVMLFLAVFLGFLAENLREHNEERNKEREYMESLVVDLQADTSLIRIADSGMNTQITQIDSLQDILSSDLNDVNVVYQAYYYSGAVQLHYAANFNESTITQLLSSGNMRLIKTDKMGNRITGYFNLIKLIDMQKQMYVDYIDKCLQNMYNVYDVYYLRRRILAADKIEFEHADWSQVRLRTTDPAVIKSFISLMEITKLVINNYRSQLILLKTSATNLLELLREDYNIRENKPEK